jgi:hypothetical protein
MDGMPYNFLNSFLQTSISELDPSANSDYANRARRPMNRIHIGMPNLAGICFTDLILMTIHRRS